MATRRSKRAASSMYAVATRTLMPGRSSRMRPISSQNCRRDSGSTPVVGSSRIRRSGSWTSAQHRPSFCFMPPESLPAGRSPEGPEAGRPGQRLDAALALGAAMAEELAEEADVLGDGKRRVEVLAEPLRHVGDAGAGLLPVPRVGHVAAERGDAALLDAAGAGDQREQARLADAVRPDEADHPPGRDLEADPVERNRRAVAQRDVAEADDGSFPGAGPAAPAGLCALSHRAASP